MYLALYPLVTLEQRAEWEAYTKEHNYWVNESIAVQEKDDTFYGPIIWDYEVYDVIHGYDEIYVSNITPTRLEVFGYYLTHSRSLHATERKPRCRGNEQHWTLSSWMAILTSDQSLPTLQLVSGVWSVCDLCC